MLNVTNAVLLALALTSGVPSKNRDGFQDVRCDSDIPSMLIGRRMPNDRVIATEGRHKDLGLKNLGATEISEKLSVISWLICGSEYMLIEDNKEIVRDVLKVPPHSKESPLFIGSGQVNGKEVPGAIVAILRFQPGKQMLPAASAWQVDEKAGKFVTFSITGLNCPHEGIITSDGGR